MTKKMNKANARLAEARAAVERATAKLNAKHTEPAKVSKPVIRQDAVLYNGKRIDSAVPVKLSKGNWRVKATSNGQPVEVLRRFKSITVANQWIADHVQS